MDLYSCLYVFFAIKATDAASRSPRHWS